MIKKAKLSEIVAKSLTFWYLIASVVLVFILSDSSIFQYEIWLLYLFVFMSSKAVVGNFD